MRRTACGLAAAVLGSLAVAAPASADKEITDPCGPGGASLPTLVNRDVTVPWLDLCGADVRGTAGSGSLRALHVALNLAGDSSNRANSASYKFSFATGTCTATLSYEDVIPPAPGGKYSLAGQCGGKLQPCEPPLPGESCSQWVGGAEFNRVLPNAGVKLLASQVTLDFDPNALPEHAVPQAFLDGFQSGKSLSSLWATTWVRSQAGTTDNDGVYALVDDASTDKAAGLGRSRSRARR